MAQAPVANFSTTATTGCAPVFVNFTDQSTGNPKAWYWDFGNGNLSQVQNPQGIGFSAGTYSITLTVKNADGVNSITKTNLVVSNPSPSTNYTADKKVACAPSTIQFTDLSVANAGTINSWLWDFGDGVAGAPSTSTDQNPTHTYTAPGYYTLSLKTTNTAGCSYIAINSRYIRIVSGVKANFDFTPPSTCTPPFLVPFSNLTSGPGNLTYSWDFGNTTTSSATSPTTTYAATGNYTVKLTAQSDYGCSDVVQKNVAVTGSATSFTAPASVCLGDAATFQSTASPAPTKILWNFGDGTTSTQATVSKTYTAAGTYTVKLYTTFGSCSDSATKTFVVNDKPVVDFIANPILRCLVPSPTTFTNNSPDYVSSSWTFGDGGTSTAANPVHTYTSFNTYTVSLAITDSKGCKNSLTKTNYIVIYPPKPQIATLPPSVCVNQVINPTAGGSAVDGFEFFKWDFGDGSPISTASNPSHSYPTAGNYTIKLIVTTYGGCIDSTTSTVHVGLRPNIDFSVDKSDICHSQVATFTNLTTPSNSTPYVWNFGDGTTDNSFNPPPHKFTDSGYYTITLTATSDGCTDSAFKTNFIHVKPPVADFGYSITDCNNKKAVTFSDSTFNNATAYGSLVYKWNFGDPGLPDATTQNPNATYSNFGTYSVKLIVNNTVCVDSITKQITLVDVTPQLAALPTTTFCRNEDIKFTSVNNTNVKTFTWVVDGVSAIGSSSFITSFSASGTHNIKLIVTDINGCNDSTALQPVTITGPTALFTVKNKGGCANSAITINDASFTGTVNTLTKWVFDFGDGTGDITFNAPPFTHKYADSGTYDIKLTVYDNTSSSCFDTYILPAGAVITKPKAKFGSAATVYCPNTALQFTDSSSGRTLTYSWNFGDGVTSTLQNPIHLYPPVDSAYDVKLVVTDSVGCSDSTTLNKYIAIRSPKSSFTAKDTVTFCPPLETTFTSTAKNYASVLWDFGDGSPTIADDENPKYHFYNSFGTYTAKLYAYGYGGCVDSSSFVINVLDPKAVTTIAFDPKTACNFLNVTFNLTIPNDVKYLFTFGDGASYIDSLPQTTFQHLYNSPNIYTPAVLLTDKTNCQAVVGSPSVVTINGAISIFGMDKKKFCDSGTIYFTDYSQQAKDPILTKTWDFGDGSTYTANGDTTHKYTQPGLYVPTLILTTAANCTSTYTDTVRVLATPKPIINSNPSVCIDLALDFAGSVLIPPDTGIIWKWDLGGGQTSSEQNISVKYADTGLYHIALQATNSLGCKGDTTKDITVYPLPVIKLVGDTTILAGNSIIGAPIPLTYSSNVTTYTWTPPTNLSCSDCPNPVANIKFTTTYNVKVTDVNGCVASRNVTMVVLCNNKNFFIPNTFSPNNDGNNDKFYPRGTGLDRIQALRIFNRWGEMVFEKRNFPANDATSGWDGTYKGQKAASDTYVYMVDIICENATIITYKGNITLIR
ncbi:MAG: PKD domain-containing protein [Chitinophagaceae bacterium]